MKSRAHTRKSLNIGANHFNCDSNFHISSTINFLAMAKLILNYIIASKMNIRHPHPGEQGTKSKSNVACPVHIIIMSHAT